MDAGWSDDEELQVDEDALPTGSGTTGSDTSSVASGWQHGASARALKRRAARASKRGPVRKWRGNHLWAVTLNARGLCSADTDKISSLHQLLESRARFGRGFPDVVTITEVNLAAGDPLTLKDRLGAKFSKHYHMFWTLRTIGHDGEPLPATRTGMIGGGVCTLVHRRLHMSAREFKVDLTSEQARWATGHVHSLRLDPLPIPMGTMAKPWWPRRPIVLAGAYVPPHGTVGWSQPTIREAIVESLLASMMAMHRICKVEGAFPIILAHTNSPDGNCPVELRVQHEIELKAVTAGIALNNARLARPRARTGAQLSLRSSKVMMQRSQCKAVSALTAATKGAGGVRLAQCAAELGLVSAAGVTDHLQPTSWKGCAECGGLDDALPSICQHADRWQLHAVHDVIFVPCMLVWQATTAPNGGAHLLRLTTRRGGSQGRAWSKCVDHCVTAARIWIGPVHDHHVQTVADADEEGQKDAAAARPKRVRRPHHLLHKYKVGLAVARQLDNNMFGLLNTARDPASDIDTLEAEMLAAARHARDVGVEEANRLSQHDPIQSASKYKDVRQARKKYHLAMLATNKALAERIRVEGVRHAAAKKKRRTCETHVRVEVDLATRAVCTARIAQKKALACLRKSILVSDARFLRIGQRLGPKAAWIKQLKLTTDAGSPLENSCKLLEYLTDGAGNVTSRQRADNILRLQANRRAVSQVSSALTAPCEEKLSEALVVISMHNQELVDKAGSKVHRDSVVAVTAHNPMAEWRSIDERRGVQHRDLHKMLDQFANERTRGAPHAAFAKRDHVKLTYPEAHARLQAPYTVGEVAAAMAKIEDVGSGVDSVEPVVWTCHDTLHKCHACRHAAAAVSEEESARLRREDQLQDDTTEEVLEDDHGPCHTAEAMCALINRLHAEARIPSSWRHHRSLAHYKGKKTDPHCPDNYRYLGIGPSALHLMSLVMLERLNTFLTETNGLSRAQHGFQRGRGTPEAILTLTEAVRAALRRQAVVITFVDITRAYDSVLFPILWQKCIDKGIDGSFLAVLQSIYFRADTQLDIGGILLDAVPWEAGCVQGNALSPALFNIYIDEPIRELEAAGRRHLAETGRAFGLPVPRTAGDGKTWAHSAVLEQEDFLPASFYADDGALLETDEVIMQTMLDTLSLALSNIGLTMNVRKTKCMIVAKFGSTAALHEAHVQRVVKNPLRVNGQAVDMVDQFDYLGAMVNSAWSWANAWPEACKEVRSALGRSLAGGFNRTGTLDAMRQHADGKILCHLTYILALTGAGGVAPREGQKAIHQVLQSIAGYPFLNGDALAIEAGAWDLETRTHNLLLRFWCKIASSDPLSLVYRAACLSIEQWHRPYELDVHRPRTRFCVPWTPARVYQDPSTWYTRANFISRQPWAQQLARAAVAFNLDVTAVLQMRVSSVVRLQVRRSAPPTVWDDIDVHDAAVIAPVHDVLPPRLRLAAVGDTRANAASFQFELSDKVTAATAFARWSPTLKQACFESLKRRGNHARQIKVQAFLIEQVQEDKHALRRWATMRSGSYRHPYWYSTDLVASRRLIRLLLGRGPHEECVRQRPYSVLAPPRQGSDHDPLNPPRVLLPRLEDRTQRVCYCCGSDNDANGWVPETLEHMLSACSHPLFVAQRHQLQTDLTLLVHANDTRAVVQQAEVPLADRIPDITNPSTLMTIFMMSVALGPEPVLRPMPLGSSSGGSSTSSTAAAAGTSTSASTTSSTSASALDRQRASTTTRWVSALLSHYTRHVRDSRLKVADPDQLPGGRLVTLVCKWAMDLFSIHRRAIRDNAEYQQRLRDPAPLLAARAAPKTSPAERAAARKHRQQQRRRPPPLGPAGRAMATIQPGNKRKVHLRGTTVVPRGTASGASLVVRVRAKMTKRYTAAAASASLFSDSGGNPIPIPPPPS